MKDFLRITLPMIVLFFVCSFTSGAGEEESTAPGKASVRLSGVITELQGDEFVVQDLSGRSILVQLEQGTTLVEKRKNFLREPLFFDRSDIVRGLNVDVKGFLGPKGVVVAKKVRFTQHDLQVARVIEPNLFRVDDDLDRLKTDSGRLSGQVDELNGFTKENRYQAKRAQGTADDALNEALAASHRVDLVEEQVDDFQNTLKLLDDYEAVDSCTVSFGADSSLISDSGKEELSLLVEAAKAWNGYLFEIRGYASADGDEAYNRRLSQRRAESVMDYLMDQHGVNPRNLVIPHGYGELHPVADNETPDGRQRNRRVEVRIVVNKGFAAVAQLEP